MTPKYIFPHVLLAILGNTTDTYLLEKNMVVLNVIIV